MLHVYKFRFTDSDDGSYIIIIIQSEYVSLNIIKVTNTNYFRELTALIRFPGMEYACIYHM